MTEPNETNEEINEELSTDELKSVSGGVCIPNSTYTVGMHVDGEGFRKPPQGSGSGMTRVDWEMRQGITRHDGYKRYKKQG